MGRAILVMIDGLRPDAIDAADCQTLRALRARSAWTMTATSVMPSVTLPCHMSIFHSVPPTRHGITTNDWMPMARPIAGLVDMAHVNFKRTAFFYNWESLRNLSRPDSLNFSLFRKNIRDADGDDIIAEDARQHILSQSFDFAFVYLGTVDEVGHDYGWMSAEYLAHAARVDRAVGHLLNALPADTTVLIQADHGGHDRSHGTDRAEDMIIPWLVAGPGIRAGYEIQRPVSLLDTAPTLCRIMGFDGHPDWEGRVVEEIFVG